MAATRFTPSVTVAAIVEQGGRFLLVEEHTADGLRLNNPAGHLERGETPLQGVMRECLEETACAFEPEALLGLYLSRFQRPALGEDITYMRIAYIGRVGEADPTRPLDQPIVRTLWLTPQEMREQAHRMRSPLVLQCMEDHLRGRRLPLSALTVDDSVLMNPLE